MYFLPLMHYSINKLKAYMLFISKNLVFSDFTWKKNDSLHGKKMIPENGRGEEPGVPHALLQCLRPKRGL